jgi:hypothetical protein
MAVQTDTAMYEPLLPAASRPETGAVFGVAGPLNASLTVVVEPRPISGRPDGNLLILDGLLLLLFVLYCLLIYRCRPIVSALFNAASVKGHLNQLAEDQSVSFRSFLRSANAAALLGVLAAGLKAALEWREYDPDSFLPEPWVPYLVLIGVAIGIILWIYKRLTNGMIALLSADAETVGKISLFHRILFAGSGLVFIPLVLLLGTVDVLQHRYLLFISLVVPAGLLLHALVKSFSFFLSRKISILQWFLYLCAVEIVPVSFFVLLALRDFQW